MSTEWVIEEVGDKSLRVDSRYSLSGAIVVAEKWIAAREVAGYNVVKIEPVKPLVRKWKLTHKNLSPITITISGWK